MVGKYLDLIVIIAFSPETIHSGEVEMVSLKGEQCMGSLHNDYLQR